MIKIVDDLIRMVFELKSVELSIDKLDIIEKYPQCRNLLEITYNPFKQFAVGKRQIVKEYDTAVVDIPKVNKPYITIQNFYSFLNDMLVGKKYSRHLSLRVMKRWCTIFPEYKDIIFDIIYKDLNCGISPQLINCIYPKLVPAFNIEHARTWDAMCDVRDFRDCIYYERPEGELLYTSVRNGKVNLYNKNGFNIKTLSYLKSELQAFIDITEKDFFVLVGTAVCDHLSGIDFNNKIVRGDENITGITYKIHDMFTTDEFEVLTDEGKIYTERHKMLINSGLSSVNMLELIKYYTYDNQDLKAFKKILFDNNWDGITLRKNMPYESRLTYNIVKILPKS